VVFLLLILSVLADVDAQSQSLEASTPEQADTAVFYSISSTQKGLAGVDLGNFLIKQVAQRVLAEFPNVQMLITLSPIPGFRNWLHTQVDAELKRLEQGGQQVGPRHCPCMTKPAVLSLRVSSTCLVALACC